MKNLLDRLLTKPEPVAAPALERLERLETAMRLLRLEVNEALDKVEHALARNSKRLRDLQSHDLEGGGHHTPIHPATLRIMTARAQRGLPTSVPGSGTAG